MRGLDPRIRVFTTGTSEDVDGRDEPGHDERRLGPGSAAHHFVLHRARETRSVIQERPKLPRPRRMLHLLYRLRLDLPDALSRPTEPLAVFCRVVVDVRPDAE